VQHRKDDVERQAGDDRAGDLGVASLRAIDREDGFITRPGDEMHFAPFPQRARRFHPRLLDHLAGDHRGRRLVGERPAAVLLDADRNRVVPRAVEIREHRRGGRQRDFVLARSSSVQHTDTQPFHGF
jgi:hypothetical protein